MAPLSDPEDLVSVNAEPPPRMRQTIVEGFARVFFARRRVHRLQNEVLEAEPNEALRVEVNLRIDKLELVALVHDEPRPRLRTDADPVDPRWSRNRAVCFDSDFEASSV